MASSSSDAHERRDAQRDALLAAPSPASEASYYAKLAAAAAASGAGHVRVERVAHGKGLVAARAFAKGERVLVVMHHPMRAPTTEAESVWSRVCLRGEVAALLQRAVADSPAVAAVLTGHLHSEMDERVGNARLLAAPSTCHQYLQEGERIRLAEDDTSGFREIVLKSDGRWTTEVVRLGAAADAAARVSTPPATA